MEEKYSGDIILISRMIEYFPQKSFEWNANEPITLDDVQFAINHHLSEAGRIKTADGSSKPSNVPLEYRNLQYPMLYG